VRLLQRRFRIRTQLLALFSLLLGTGFFVLVTDELALQDEISTFDALLHDSLSGLRLAKSISDSYRLEIVDTTFRVRNNLTGWDQGLRIVDVARSDIQRDWQALIETNLSPEQRVLADEIAKVRMIADAATDNLVSILKKQDMQELGRFASGDSPHENNYSADGKLLGITRLGGSIGLCNPRTGEALDIKAARLPKFRAGKALKDAIN